jgi:hypothetical protein
MHFEIRRSKDVEQPFYWVVVSRSGEDLGASEMMHNKDDVDDIVKKIIDTIRNTEVPIIDKTV